MRHGPDFAVKPTLAGATVVLRPFSDGDLPAVRAYEKVGFRAEGVLRESLRYNGEWHDATVMSILAPEWPPCPRPAQ